MVDEADDGDDAADPNQTSEKLRTQHEIDAYEATTSQLERTFAMNVTVREQDVQACSQIVAEQLHPAGKVFRVLEADRTVVVQACIIPESTQQASRKHPYHLAVLEEGTLLLLKIGESQQVVPLGKIFEVFGPVKEPLYSIRLPEELPTARKETANNILPLEESKRQSKNREGGDEEKNGDRGLVNGGDDKKEEAATNHDDNAKQYKSKKQNGVQVTEGTVQNEVAVAEMDSAIKDIETAVDPWSRQGDCMRFLLETPEATVYYIPDKAAILDTNKIYQISGRGCDASNMYDEEVTNPNEMYFSDDEKEREAKGGNRKTKKGAERAPRERGDQRRGAGYSSRPSQTPQPQVVPQGFYAGVPGPSPHPNVPQHPHHSQALFQSASNQPWQQQQYPQHQQQYQYPHHHQPQQPHNYNMYPAYAGAPMYSPPQPATFGQHQQQQQQLPIQHHSMLAPPPPPPPPPRQQQQPPPPPPPPAAAAPVAVEEHPDTVYYDYS